MAQSVHVLVISTRDQMHIISLHHNVEVNFISIALKPRVKLKVSMA